MTKKQIKHASRLWVACSTRQMAIKGFSQDFGIDNNYRDAILEEALNIADKMQRKDDFFITLPKIIAYVTAPDTDTGVK
jgi:hypothetical protein